MATQRLKTFLLSSEMKAQPSYYLKTRWHFHISYQLLCQVGSLGMVAMGSVLRQTMDKRILFLEECFGFNCSSNLSHCLR